MNAKQIKQRWDEADAAERQGDSLHWAVAAELSDAAEAGATQRELAEKTGRSHALVGYFIRTHRQFGKSGVAKPSSFNQAVQATKGVTNESERVRKDQSAARKVLRDEPAQIAIEIAKASPEVQEAIADALIAAKADKSLRKAVKPGPRPEPKVPSPEDKLGEGLFLIWEAGELLLDVVPGDEARIRMVNQAEKIMRLAGGIRHALDSGNIEAEFEDLVREMSAER